METWKILLITLLSAVVLGCIIGIATGKHQVKKARGAYRPLLTGKERLVYSLCVVFGAACILFGIFVAPNLDMQGQDIVFDEFGNPMEGRIVDEMIDGGMAAGALPEGGMIGDDMPEDDMPEDEMVESEAAADKAVEDSGAAQARPKVVIQGGGGGAVHYSNGGATASVTVIG